MPKVLPTQKRPRQTIQSVSRSSKILVTIANSADGLTASEISARFDLALPTAYHLLATLEDEGLLAKDAGKRYVLGASAAAIANAPSLRPRIPRKHRFALRHLAESTQETAYLTAWFRNEIRILATVEGSQAVRVAGLEVGNTKDVHARASAKLLLAYSDPDRRDMILDGHDFTAFTSKTVRDRDALDRDLEQIRRAGFVHDGGEYREDVRSLSAPIIVEGEVTAALAVLAPADRFARTEGRLLAALKEAAAMAAGNA